MPAVSPPSWVPSREDQQGPVPPPQAGGSGAYGGRPQERVTIKKVQERLGMVRSDYAALQSEYDTLLQEYSKMMVRGHVHSAQDKVCRNTCSTATGSASILGGDSISDMGGGDGAVPGRVHEGYRGQHLTRSGLGSGTAIPTGMGWSVCRCSVSRGHVDVL
jgi:hypothetical protein